MNHPHVHNLTALAAVVEFTRERGLPLTDVHLPGSPYADGDRITLETGWDTMADPGDTTTIDPWLAALPPSAWDDRLDIRTPSRVGEGLEVRRVTLRGELEPHGIRVSVVGRWYERSESPS